MQAESLKKLPRVRLKSSEQGKKFLLACMISECYQELPTSHQGCTRVIPGAASCFWGILKEPVQSCLPLLGGASTPPLLTKLLSMHRGSAESPDTGHWTQQVLFSL